LSLPEGFEAAIKPLDQAAPDSLTFAFQGRNLLVVLDDTESVATAAKSGASGFEPVRRQVLGTYGGEDILSLEMSEHAQPPPGMAFEELRGLFLRLSEPHFWIAARAVQIVSWDRDHQICGRCGSATEDQSGEHAKRCPACDLIHYPRLSPAVIVLVERSNEILLGRSPHFPPGMFSTLAGFVEAGETLEQTVAREIAEEVGIQVCNVRYFGSQPWPFPNSLMLGFRADYASGEINVDGEEVEEAAWFNIAALPRIPPRISIARALIDAWLSEQE